VSFRTVSQCIQDGRNRGFGSQCLQNPSYKPGAPTVSGAVQGPPIVPGPVKKRTVLHSQQAVSGATVWCLMHLFQHQIHRRRQVMLSGTAIKSPQLDEFFSIAEAPPLAGEFDNLGWNRRNGVATVTSTMAAKSSVIHLTAPAFSVNFT
jgi:hypothetical protein